jgi:hypothetical protein
MSAILSYVGVTESGSALSRFIDGVTEDLVIGAGVVWPANFQLFVASTVAGTWTLDFTVMFVSLPNDFSNIPSDGLYVGQNTVGGNNGGLFFSKAGIAWAPCVRVVAGALTPDSYSVLPSSQFLISEGEYYSFRIAVSQTSGKSYIYVTKTSDLSTIGHQLRYVLAATSSATCLSSQSRTIVGANGLATANVLSLDSICLADGLIVPDTCDPIHTITKNLSMQWGLGMWGLQAWGGAGLYTFTVVGAGQPNPTQITPITGSTIGGDEFVLTGTDLATFFYNDTFSDGVLNNVLWGQLGPNPVTEGPIGPAGAVQCNTGSIPGSYSGIEAQLLKLKGDFHDQIDFNISTNFLKNLPASEVTLAAIEAYDDPGNFIRLSYIVKGPTAKTGTIRCEVWKGGVQLHVLEQPYSASTGTLGIMRYYDDVEQDSRAVFWLNGNQIQKTFDAPSCTLTLRIFSFNGGSPYQIQSSFDSFKAKTVVLFKGPSGVEPSTAVIEVSEFRVRGLTPATVGEWAGLVDIQVSNGAGTCCRGTLAQAFTYVYPEAFVVGRAQPFRPTTREMSLTNDPALRNIGPNVGNSLRKQF